MHFHGPTGLVMGFSMLDGLSRRSTAKRIFQSSCNVSLEVAQEQARAGRQKRATTVISRVAVCIIAWSLHRAKEVQRLSHRDSPNAASTQYNLEASLQLLCINERQRYNGLTRLGVAGAYSRAVGHSRCISRRAASKSASRSADFPIQLPIASILAQRDAPLSRLAIRPPTPDLPGTVVNVPFLGLSQLLPAC